LQKDTLVVYLFAWYGDFLKKCKKYLVNIYLSISSSLYSTAHKNIALLYGGLGIGVGSFAGSMSALFRYNLSGGGSTNDSLLLGDGGLYNTLITAHGLLMVFFL